MANQSKDATVDVDCCPTLEPCDVCDSIDVRYRLPFRPVVDVAGQRRVVPVEVTLVFRLTRCAGPLSLGDILYSTTLLPGEKVRLVTSDRHSQFSFDSETNLSYYNHTTLRRVVLHGRHGERGQQRERERERRRDVLVPQLVGQRRRRARHRPRVHLASAAVRREAPTTPARRARSPTT